MEYLAVPGFKPGFPGIEPGTAKWHVWMFAQSHAIPDEKLHKKTFWLNIIVFFLEKIVRYFRKRSPKPEEVECQSQVSSTGDLESLFNVAGAVATQEQCREQRRLNEEARTKLLLEIDKICSANSS